MRAGGDGLVAEHASRANHTDWRLLFLHRAHLQRGGVRAQQHIGMQFHEEGVLHIAGRVLLRKVQSGEHMPVVLNIGTRDSGESDVLKNTAYLVHHDGDGVHGAHGDVGGRTRHIRDAAHGANRSFHLGSLLLKTLLGHVFQLVQHLTETFALFRRNILDFSKHGLKLALLAQEEKTELLQRFRIFNNVILYFRFYFFNGFHTMIG